MQAIVIFVQERKGKSVNIDRQIQLYDSHRSGNQVDGLPEQVQDGCKNLYRTDAMVL